jgi:hypothetical protein
VVCALRDLGVAVVHIGGGPLQHVVEDFAHG